MSKWNKNWSNEKNTRELKVAETDNTNGEIQVIKQKMRTIRKKRENPKNIPLFEDIYQRPQPSIIEGMQGNDLENNSNDLGEKLMNLSNKTGSGTKNAAKDANDSETGQSIREEVKETTQKIGRRWTNAMNTKNFTDPIANLENNLSTSIDNLSNLQNLADLGSTLNDIDIVNANEFASTADNIKDTFKIDKKGIEKVMNEVTGSMKSLSMVFSGIFAMLAQRVQQFKIYIQLFILRINKYIDDTLTKIANALTQNTATEKEIEIFKDQAQKFTTMTLVWYFVYNWYYIIFFIEKEDGILYEFDTNQLKSYNTYLYGAFGPACRVLESFNWTILKLGVLKKYIPTPIIMIIMFFVFYILVSNNFQSSILINLFNAMRGKFSMSILSLISIFIVTRYSIGWFFGSQTKGDIEMATMVSKQQTIFSICFFLVLFCVSLLCYTMWTITVNIPLAMFFISAYLSLYTFFGVLFYEGVNAGMIITGITNSIDIIEPDLTVDGCAPQDVRMGTWVWWKGLIPRFINLLKGIVNFASINMFEILIFLMLLGGIGLYKKEWNTAIEGKVGLGNNDGGLMSPDGLKNMFKQLFVWLVIINILLIFILGKFLYDKYILMSEMGQTTGKKGKSIEADQTTRSLIASRNPTMHSSETKLNRRALDRMDKINKDRLDKENEETEEENQDETPQENSQENSQENPQENSQENPQEKQEEKQQENSQENSQENPQEKQEEKQQEKQEETPEEKT